MKAVVYTTYGPPNVLRMVDIPTPGLRPNDALVRVRATTVIVGDTIMRSLRIPVRGWQKVMARVYLDWSRPKRTILGMELAGVVEAGQLRPAIDRVYPFDSIVEAHRYVDTGRKRGNVVIELERQRSCRNT